MLKYCIVCVCVCVCVCVYTHVVLECLTVCFLESVDGLTHSNGLW